MTSDQLHKIMSAQCLFSGKVSRIFGAGYTDTFDEYYQSGHRYTFQSYENNLGYYGYDNAIRSVKQTGM